MKTWNSLSTVVLPTVAGVFAVLIVLSAFNELTGNSFEMHSGDVQFFTFFVPFTILCALAFQYLFTLRFWRILKQKGMIFGMNLLAFTAVITLGGGLIFGIAFWEPGSGTPEFFWLSLTGIIAFAIYWASNLSTLKCLDRT